jgi:hypothetical protein
VKIISRKAFDSLEAFYIAQGMENSGVDVFSITHDGEHIQRGYSLPSSRFVVWGKYIDGTTTADKMDDAISVMRNRLTPPTPAESEQK